MNITFKKWKAQDNHYAINSQWTHYKPEEAIMVGDRIDNDIIPANKIGMKTVWIKQGFGSYAEPKTVEEQPDYIVNSLVEIAELFR